MRKSLIVLVAVATVVTAMPALAELQNITWDGELRIRGNWYTGHSIGDNPRARNPLFDPPWTRATGNAGLRFPAPSIATRAIGNRGVAGALPSFTSPAPGGGILSPFPWDDNFSHSHTYVESRARLGMNADFTDEVSLRIEFDSYDIWGEDFRSNYVTGADGRAAAFDDVEVYQAYIEANEMWGYPVGMRIGRQEIALGSQWLVGVNDTASGFWGLSFDAIRGWWNATDTLRIDAFWAKLADTSPVEEDGDVDFYGIYGSYTGLEEITIDAYWLYLRDARAAQDTIDGGFFDLGGWLEDFFGVDDYEPTELHTIGLRGAGMITDSLDFEAEVAYQFGDVDSVGYLFGINGLLGSTFGDDDADVSEFAATLTVGYTFDVQWQPRAWLGVVYLGGEDDRDVNFFEWLDSLINPWAERDASVSFNRLFSNTEYSEFLENTDLSNTWIIRGGVDLAVTESVDVNVVLSYFQAVEEFDHPVYWTIFDNRITSPFAFWTETADDELGWELGLYVSYDYSEDLNFEMGWAHLFVGDGLEEGNFVNANGLGFNGGLNDDDADYLYVQTTLSF